jgi:hypothetical protein
MPHWSDPLNAIPTAFRIRVGNEEIALSMGVTLVGRDATCRISIFDSLISRQHARIQCDDEQAVIEDLGSRNGTRVNGVAISGPHVLRDGDRIGIGSVELVVAVVDPKLNPADMPTGVQTVCPDCRNVYPASLHACPKCGSNKPAPPQGKRNGEARRTRWSLGMLLEMLGRSILTESTQEAEKLMRQASVIVADRMREDKPIAADELRALEEAAKWIDKAHKNTAWQDWMGRVRGTGQKRATVRPPPPK